METRNRTKWEFLNERLHRDSAGQSAVQGRALLRHQGRLPRLARAHAHHFQPGSKGLFRADGRGEGKPGQDDRCGKEARRIGTQTRRVQHRYELRRIRRADRVPLPLPSDTQVPR